MKTFEASELLRHELRLLELRRVTRSLEHRRLTLTSEKESLAEEIERILIETAEGPSR